MPRPRLSWLVKLYGNLTYVRMRPAAIELNYSVKDIRHDVRQIIYNNWGERERACHVKFGPPQNTFRPEQIFQINREIFGPTLKKTFHVRVRANQAAGAVRDRQKLSRRYCIKAVLEMV